MPMAMPAPSASPLRVVIADDERPARAFLASTLRNIAAVELVGEATGGADAVALIERVRPELALLDLHMPEVDGLAVVRLVKPDCLPLIAFVTAYDEYAVRAFELNAIDYLLKPVEPDRLRRTIARAREQLDAHRAVRDAEHVRAAADAVARTAPAGYLQRIPVRQRDEIIILSVDQILSITVDGDLLYLTNAAGERYTIRYPLRDLEVRLDPERFVRVSRSALVCIHAIQRVSSLPGGSYLAWLTNNQRVHVSRARAQMLRGLFKL
jgi:two-component system LytT family response regulator